MASTARESSAAEDLQTSTTSTLQQDVAGSDHSPVSDPEKRPPAGEPAALMGPRSSPPTTTQDETAKVDDKDVNVVTWDGDNDPECPMNWSSNAKIVSVVIVSTWTFLTPLASSMVAPGILTILRDFHSTDLTLGSFIVSIYILGYAVGPLFIAPMSEIYGRLPIYHVCNILFVAWTIACAFAPSLGALLAFRFFQGVAGVCALTIGSGTIADLIPAEKRGAFMSVYSMGMEFLISSLIHNQACIANSELILGPLLGPVM